jgi:hypothetical protein
MPDAEQMLHVEEDAGGSHARSLSPTLQLSSRP